MSAANQSVEVSSLSRVGVDNLVARAATVLLFVAAIGISSLSAAATPEITPEELSRAVSEKMFQVEEFNYLREEATKLGVDIYLFGGTAAGFAHYVRWDLLRQKGDPRYQDVSRFDFDFTNIYRSTQDLDIVVDAPEETVKKLQALLSKKFPQFQGSKDAWELRPLRTAMGHKMALLNNPHFLNQHTDSNSVGLIKLTEKGSNPVHDLKDWNSATPRFLKDVAAGELHFYESNNHKDTKFYIEGRNPEIFSVVRYVIKAAQFGLKVPPEDMKKLKRIVEAFNPKHLSGNLEYQKKWFENNGKKIISNAVNLETAVKLADDLGLRQKLIAIEGNAATADTLAWWLSRKPLASFPIGSGSGKTARELKLDVLSHETRTYVAYESMTRGEAGRVNALVSRKDVKGEVAYHGEGFYTRKGTIGAVDSGLNIRVHLHPDAKEGTDFRRVHTDYVIILNSNAITLIPEPMISSFDDGFKKLLELPSSERAYATRIMRKIKGYLALLPHDESAQKASELLAGKKQHSLGLELLMVGLTQSAIATGNSPMLKVLLPAARQLTGFNSGWVEKTLTTPLSDKLESLEDPTQRMARYRPIAFAASTSHSIERVKAIQGITRVAIDTKDRALSRELLDLTEKLKDAWKNEWLTTNIREKIFEAAEKTWAPADYFAFLSEIALESPKYNTNRVLAIKQLLPLSLAGSDSVLLKKILEIADAMPKNGWKDTWVLNNIQKPVRDKLETLMPLPERLAMYEKTVYQTPKYADGIKDDVLKLLKVLIESRNQSGLKRLAKFADEMALNGWRPEWIDSNIRGPAITQLLGIMSADELEAFETEMLAYHSDRVFDSPKRTDKRSRHLKQLLKLATETMDRATLERLAEHSEKMTDGWNVDWVKQNIFTPASDALDKLLSPAEIAVRSERILFASLKHSWSRSRALQKLVAHALATSNENLAGRITTHARKLEFNQNWIQTNVITPLHKLTEAERARSKIIEERLRLERERQEAIVRQKAEEEARREAEQKAAELEVKKRLAEQDLNAYRLVIRDAKTLDQFFAAISQYETASENFFKWGLIASMPRKGESFRFIYLDKYFSLKPSAAQLQRDLKDVDVNHLSFQVWTSAILRAANKTEASSYFDVLFTLAPRMTQATREIIIEQLEAVMIAKGYSFEYYNQVRSRLGFRMIPQRESTYRLPVRAFPRVCQQLF